MRKNGVLLHISSLPSPYGIGTLGQDAYDFVDYLEKHGQSLWQLLPVCPTSYGDSPYASYSTFAGNPYFIDLDKLAEEGLLNKADYENIDWSDTPDRVNYGKIYNNRFAVLKKAVEKFLENPAEDYHEFCEKNSDWLEDYALFMALKEKNDGRPWQQWDDRERVYTVANANVLRQENWETYEFYKVLQYLFYKQWNELHDYAGKHGVQIIGDLPIYVAMDSVDVWSHPELFALDEDRNPISVAGCPPDGFSADGQLWGNPLYNWKHHKDTNYEWWTRRVSQMLHTFDILRIDHFRGFESYYAIPADAKTARTGEWLQGPGADLFAVIEEKLGPQPIIAEDLGFLTPSVKEMLEKVGYPGMKILEFAFDPRDMSSSDYLPYKYPKNSVAYVGTHDNDTAAGWQVNADADAVAFAREFIDNQDPAMFHWDMIRTLLASPADTTIVQAQDMLGLGSETRMNTPSTVGVNWTWRLKPGQMDEETGHLLEYLTKLFGRLPEPKKEVTAEEITVEDAAEPTTENVEN